MAEDIWGEKPDWKAEVIEKNGKPFFDEDPIWVFEKMDAWLEKLKADYDSRWRFVGRQLGEAMERAVEAEEKLEAVKKNLKYLEMQCNAKGHLSKAIIKNIAKHLRLAVEGKGGKVNG